MIGREREADLADEKTAARILGVTARTLRRWRVGGQIAYYRLPGGHIRYSADQLIDFKNSCRVAATRAAA
jgi:excisionase family DNA binding protein